MMEHNPHTENVGVVLLHKTTQVLEECSLSDDPKYTQKMFNEKVAALEKAINTLLPELKMKDLDVFNRVLMSSFELGVVSASVERKRSMIKEENPITG